MDTTDIMNSLEESFSISKASQELQESIKKSVKMAKNMEVKDPIQFCINAVLLNHTSLSLKDKVEAGKDNKILNQMRLFSFGI